MIWTSSPICWAWLALSKLSKLFCLLLQNRLFQLCRCQKKEKLVSSTCLLRISNRESAGLAQHEVPPAYHSTDTYIKHRKLLQSFWRQKFKVKMQTVSDTPRSDARSLEPAEDAAPTKQLVCAARARFCCKPFPRWALGDKRFSCRIAHGLSPQRITGDPHHDCIALNRLVPPSCSDGRTWETITAWWKG